MTSSGTAVAGGALFDRSGAYRYRLWRRWGSGAPAVFVLLNPSTADATEDDPTIRRCMGFARRWGWEAVEVVNLFALRSRDPGALRAVADPVGPRNDAHLRAAARGAGTIVAGWGAAGRPVPARALAVLAGPLGPPCALYALGRTASGAPRHPLYAAAAAELQRWP